MCRWCGAEEEISPHVSCKCEALATLGHTSLGSFSLDPEDVRSLILGEICNVIKRREIPRLGHQSKGYKGPAKDPHVSGKKG